MDTDCNLKKNQNSDPDISKNRYPDPDPEVQEIAIRMWTDLNLASSKAEENDTAGELIESLRNFTRSCKYNFNTYLLRLFFYLKNPRYKLDNKNTKGFQKNDVFM